MYVNHPLKFQYCQHFTNFFADRLTVLTLTFKVNVTFRNGMFYCVLRYLQKKVTSILKFHHNHTLPVVLFYYLINYCSEYIHGKIRFVFNKQNEMSKNKICRSYMSIKFLKQYHFWKT